MVKGWRSQGISKIKSRGEAPFHGGPRPVARKIRAIWNYNSSNIGGHAGLPHTTCGVLGELTGEVENLVLIYKGYFEDCIISILESYEI